MPAEWQLRAYRIELGQLIKLVGSGDEGLAAAVVAAAQELELDSDNRIGENLSSAKIVTELTEGTLVAKHATGYRIALPAFADVTGVRLKFDVNQWSRGYQALTIAADRRDLGPILHKVGLPTLAVGWERASIAWPWAVEPKPVVWPAARYWTAAELMSSTQELAAALRKGSLPDRVRECSADSFFADDNAIVVSVIEQLVSGAYAKLPVKLPRCAGSAADGLLLLLDGEQ